MTLSFEQIAVALGSGTVDVAGCATSYSIDTRTIRPGALFVALRGASSDGRRYVPEAFAKGAAAALVDRTYAREAAGIFPAGFVCFVVDDVLAGLERLAAWARKHWAARRGSRRRQVVGITGSAGKTTTKDAVAALVSAVVPVGKTSGNYNNHIGLPLSLLGLSEEAQVAVVEMGMNHAGEIRALARIARPDIGVVTNVGHAHVENFDSIDGIALAKRELIEELPYDGCAVLNADDDRVAAFHKVHPGRSILYGTSAGAEVRAETAEFRPEGVRFRVAGAGEFETSLAGRHGLSNALAALATARALDIPLDEVREALRALEPPDMRGRRLVRNGVTIWDDCYNANPEAMRAMLDVLRDSAAARRIAVLGEMRELGELSETLHRAVGRHAASSGLSLLIAVRGGARFLAEEARANGMAADSVLFFEEPAEAGEFLKGKLQAGDALLFKGSRGTAVETALEKILE